MAKSLTASEMLGRVERIAEATLEQQSAAVPRHTADKAPSSLDDQKPSSLTSKRYEKMSAFLTPEQRLWLRSTTRSLPVDGLSASDVVRLAIDQLRASVDDGLPLVEMLIARAHADAEQFSGRRNRGLPSLGN